MTPSPRSSPTLATKLSKATCFSYSKVGHFTSSCPNSHITLKINKIKQDTSASSNKVHNKTNTDSESETTSPKLRLPP